MGAKRITICNHNLWGKHGKKAGYQDIKNQDGTWHYIGQGSKGDQDPSSFANRLLTERNVLLFSTREPTTIEAKERGNNNSKVYLMLFL